MVMYYVMRVGICIILSKIMIYSRMVSTTVKYDY